MVVGIRDDRGHDRLNRGEPQGKVARVVLEENPGEALERAEQGSMEHHRSVLAAVLADVGRPQPLRQVEVHLEGAALPVTSDRVAQDELELGAVEGPLAGIDGEVEPGGFDRRPERRLGPVPDLVRSDPPFRPVGELDVHVLEAEITVDAQDELAHPPALVGDLLRGAEDVGVVLGERAHPQEPVEGAGRLEAVHLPELAHA